MLVCAHMRVSMWAFLSLEIIKELSDRFNLTFSNVGIS